MVPAVLNSETLVAIVLETQPFPTNRAALNMVWGGAVALLSLTIITVILLVGLRIVRLFGPQRLSGAVVSPYLSGALFVILFYAILVSAMGGLWGYTLVLGAVALLFFGFLVRLISRS